MSEGDNLCRMSFEDSDHVVPLGDSEYWLALGQPSNKAPQEATLRRNGTNDPPGMLRASSYITGKFSQPMFLHQFPFDLQSLGIAIRLVGAGISSDSDHCRYLVSMQNSCGHGHVGRASHSQFNHVEWYIHQPVARTDGGFGQKQKLQCVLPVSRKSTYYTKAVVIPVGLLTSTAFIAFLLDTESLGERSGIVLTMLLTMTAYKLVVSDKLPKLAYSTILDNYIDSAFVTIFAVCLENVIVFKYANNVESNIAYAIVALWGALNIYMIYAVAAAQYCASQTVGPALQEPRPHSANPFFEEMEEACRQGKWD